MSCQSEDSIAVVHDSHSDNAYSSDREVIEELSIFRFVEFFAYAFSYDAGGLDREDSIDRCVEIPWGLREVSGVLTPSFKLSLESP